MNLLKWQNCGQPGSSREGAELEINSLILLGAGLLHGGDRHKIRWKIQTPSFRQNIADLDPGDQDE